MRDIAMHAAGERHAAGPGPAPVPALDRRGFVGLCAGALAALALGGCASLVTRQVRPVDGRVELALAHYPELLEPGGAIKILPEGGGP
ncbi:MAG: twin-arginine translocation signal domain-containing protein, partial [Gemmatimonadota bacterium]|nr:twin-arginine translocation signal domain-containing protein [Gemmatimonadota bacterium]